MTYIDDIRTYNGIVLWILSQEDTCDLWRHGKPYKPGNKASAAHLRKILLDFCNEIGLKPQAGTIANGMQVHKHFDQFMSWYLEKYKMAYLDTRPENENIIPEDHKPSNFVSGLTYHLTWARKRGMCWKLHKINGDKAILFTPKTKRKLVALKKDLRHTNLRVWQKSQVRRGLINNPDIINNI